MPNWGLGEDECGRCEAAERDAATRQAIADDRWAAIERLEAVVAHLRKQNAMLMEELASADQAATVDAARAKRLYDHMGQSDRFELHRWRAVALQYAAHLSRLGVKVTLPDAGEAQAGNAPALGGA